jgi:hypothetical protein
MEDELDTTLDPGGVKLPYKALWRVVNEDKVELTEELLARIYSSVYPELLDISALLQLWAELMHNNDGKIVYALRCMPQQCNGLLWDAQPRKKTKKRTNHINYIDTWALQKGNSNTWILIFTILAGGMSTPPLQYLLRSQK